MNKNLKGLYDLKNSNMPELSKFEEQKLRKEVMSNKKLFAQNKDLFAEEKRFCFLEISVISQKKFQNPYFSSI